MLCESLLSPSTRRNRFPERFRLPASRENNTWPPVKELVSLPLKKLKIKSLLEIYSTTWKQFWVTTTKPEKLAEFSCRSNLIWTHLNVSLFLFFHFLVKTQRHQLPSQVKPTLYTGGSNGKESACNAGDLGSIPGAGRSPGEGNVYPLQYPCLENSMDRGAWWAQNVLPESNCEETNKSKLRVILQTVILSSTNMFIPYRQTEGCWPEGDSREVTIT